MGYLVLCARISCARYMFDFSQRPCYTLQFFLEPSAIISDREQCHLNSSRRSVNVSVGRILLIRKSGTGKNDTKKWQQKNDRCEKK